MSNFYSICYLVGQELAEQPAPLAMATIAAECGNAAADCLSLICILPRYQLRQTTTTITTTNALRGTLNLWEQTRASPTLCGCDCVGGCVSNCEGEVQQNCAIAFISKFLFALSICPRCGNMCSYAQWFWLSEICNESKDKKSKSFDCLQNWMGKDWGRDNYDELIFKH